MGRRGAHNLVRTVLVAMALGAVATGVTVTALADPEPAAAAPVPEAIQTSATSVQAAALPPPAQPPAAPPITTSAPATTSAAPVPSDPAVPSTPATTDAPPTTTTPDPEPEPSPEPKAGRIDVLTITNQERSKAGCAPLVTDVRLDNAAAGHSNDMARNHYFSHTSQDGRTFVDRARAAGYPNPGAENIAKGQRTAEEVMASWMSSPGHRANILNCGLRTMGLGLATNGNYWTQLFGW